MNLPKHLEEKMEALQVSPKHKRDLDYNLTIELAMLSCYAEMIQDMREILNALKEVNKEELNNQRPGGGYSRSATISYNAIQKFNSRYGEGK